MELTVFEGERQVGTLNVEPDGLFYDFSCQLTQSREQIRRVFVGYGWRSEYLGIPDASGALKARLPKKRLPDGVSFAVAANVPRGEWLPWRGEADGVPIAEGYIRCTEEGIDLLLPPQEALKLPAWAEDMHTKTVLGREFAMLTLLPDGTLPERKTEKGEDTDEEIFNGNTVDRVPADVAPDERDCVEGRETDCTDL